MPPPSSASFPRICLSLTVRSSCRARFRRRALSRRCSRSRSGDATTASVTGCRAVCRCAAPDDEPRWDETDRARGVDRDHRCRSTSVDRVMPPSSISVSGFLDDDVFVVRACADLDRVTVRGRIDRVLIVSKSPVPGQTVHRRRRRAAWVPRSAERVGARRDDGVQRTPGSASGGHAATLKRVRRRCRQFRRDQKTLSGVVRNGTIAIEPVTCASIASVSTRCSRSPRSRSRDPRSCSCRDVPSGYQRSIEQACGDPGALHLAGVLSARRELGHVRPEARLVGACATRMPFTFGGARPRSLYCSSGRSRPRAPKGPRRPRSPPSARPEGIYDWPGKATCLLPPRLAPHAEAPNPT